MQKQVNRNKFQWEMWCEDVGINNYGLHFTNLPYLLCCHWTVQVSEDNTSMFQWLTRVVFHNYITGELYNFNGWTLRKLFCHMSVLFKFSFTYTDFTLPYYLFTVFIYYIFSLFLAVLTEKRINNLKVKRNQIIQ